MKPKSLLPPYTAIIIVYNCYVKHIWIFQNDQIKRKVSDTPVSYVQCYYIWLCSMKLYFKAIQGSKGRIFRKYGVHVCDFVIYKILKRPTPR